MNKKLLLALAAALPAVPALADGITYQIDPTHTFVVFEADHHAVSTVRGRFGRSEGTVLLDRQARTGRAEIVVDAASIDTGVRPFDGKLKSADFFNVAEMAQLKFSGDAFTFDGDKLTAVSGGLTLLGRTLPMTLKATRFNCYTNPLLKREVCGGDFETTIVRSQWGMTYGVDHGLPDRVHVLVQVEAVRQ